MAFRAAVRAARVNLTGRGTARVVRRFGTFALARTLLPGNALGAARACALVAVGGALCTVGTAFADSSVNYDQVKKDIESVLEKEGYDDGSYGPVLIRLAWHASGTFEKAGNSGGSNGATMRFKPESAHGANAGLDVARALLEPIKRAHPNISYADLWTLAGCVAIEAMGGPQIRWRPGRTDVPVTEGEKKCPPDGRLPDALQGAAHVRAIFGRMGFNDREIVALLGAHSVGRCHTDRSGFKGPWTKAPTFFSNEFYRELLETKWTPKQWKGPLQYKDPKDEIMMLPTDLALIQDPEFRKYVELYSKDEQVFFKDFAAAWTKLIENGVPAFQEKPGMFSWLWGK